MEQRVSIISLVVTDLDRSIAFYEHLKWIRSFPAAEGVTFSQNGGHFWEIARNPHFPITGNGSIMLPT